MVELLTIGAIQVPLPFFPLHVICTSNSQVHSQFDKRGYEREYADRYEPVILDEILVLSFESQESMNAAKHFMTDKLTCWRHISFYATSLQHTFH